MGKILCGALIAIILIGFYLFNYLVFDTCLSDDVGFNYGKKRMRNRRRKTKGFWKKFFFGGYQERGDFLALSSFLDQPIRFYTDAYLSDCYCLKQCDRGAIGFLNKQRNIHSIAHSGFICPVGFV